jgi:hypothetical protein
LDIDNEEMPLEDTNIEMSPAPDLGSLENVDVSMLDAILEDTSVKMSPAPDAGSLENVDVCMLDAADDVVDASADVPNHDDIASPEGSTHLYGVEVVSIMKGKSESQTADCATLTQTLKNDAARSSDTPQKSDDGSGEGGAVYMSLCALAVAGACFFYQKLWKS